MATPNVLVQQIGGKINAELIFQSAFDDSNEKKDWNLISSKLSNISPEKAEEWFNKVINFRKVTRKRWTKDEDAILKKLLGNPQIKNEEIFEIFQNRTKRSVYLRIVKMKKDLKENKSKSEDPPQDENKNIINIQNST